jgi:hypothetical protein
MLLRRFRSFTKRLNWFANPMAGGSSTIEIFEIFDHRFCIKTLVYVSGRRPISSLLELKL